MLPLLALPTLVATLLAPPSDPSAPTAGLPAEGADSNELVVHALSDVLPRAEALHTVPWFAAGDAPYPEELPSNLESTIEALVYDLFGEELEYEGRSLELHGGGRLVVRAPRSVQDEVRGLLSGLEAGFQRSARVTVRVYDVLDPQRLSGTPAPGALDTLAREGALRAVWSRTQDVALGATTAMGGTIERQYLEGYDREVAQEADAMLPRFARLREGVEVLLRVEEDARGYAVRSLARRADLRDLEQREASSARTITLETVVQADRRPAALELPTLENAFAAGSRVLQPGGHAVHVLWTSTEQGIAGCVIDLSLDAVDPPPKPFTVRGRDVLVVDASRATWGPITAMDPDSAALAPHAEAHVSISACERWGGEPRSVGFPSETFDGSAFEGALLALSGEEDVGFYGDGNWIVLSGDGAGLAASVASARAANATRRLSLRVGVTESGPRAEQRLRALVDLPMETFSTAFALVGDLRGLASTIEADVAMGLSSTSPVQGEVFDGLVVRATAGERSVAVDLALARLDGVETIPLRGLIGMDVDRPVIVRGDGHARVPCDGEQHEVATLPEGGRELHVWVEARVD